MHDNFFEVPANCWHMHRYSKTTIDLYFLLVILISLTSRRFETLKKYSVRFTTYRDHIRFAFNIST